MRQTKIFITLIAIVVTTYLLAPQLLPDYINPDIKDLEQNIYVTPFGIQSNTRAKSLCERYQRRFISLQGTTTKKQKESAQRMYNSYAADPKMNSYADRYATEIDYYENTLKLLRKADVALRYDSTVWVDCDHLIHKLPSWAPSEPKSLEERNKTGVHGFWAQERKRAT